MLAGSESSLLTRDSTPSAYFLDSNRYGHAFIMDTGASTGEISGHVKVHILFYNPDLVLIETDYYYRQSMRSPSDLKDLTEL